VTDLLEIHDLAGKLPEPRTTLSQCILLPSQTLQLTSSDSQHTLTLERGGVPGVENS
jgi:hypothetical protein